MNYLFYENDPGVPPADYTDANTKPSKPSPVHEEVTVDNFKEK